MTSGQPSTCSVSDRISGSLRSCRYVPVPFHQTMRVHCVLTSTCSSQSWAEADKASTQETLSTLHELNRCLRLRLAVSEALPSAMKMYSISQFRLLLSPRHRVHQVAFSDDGKALFKVPGLFEASVTLAGSEPSDRWFLLDISFLTNFSSSSSSPGTSFPTIRIRCDLLTCAALSTDESRTELDPTLKTQIVELGNRVLTDDPPEGLTKLKNQSKPALVRLYEFLGAFVHLKKRESEEADQVCWGLDREPRIEL